MQRENVVNNKVILNLIQNLQRLSWLLSLRNNVRGRFQIKFGMTPNFYYDNSMGFTLIELLVVVLIIGILAAVALPQYTQAVEKSRFATYRALANSMAQSAEAYYLANSSWPTSLDELDLEFPADMSTQNDVSHGVCRKNNKIFCCITFADAVFGSGGSAKCGDNDYHLMYARGYANYHGTPIQQMSCIAKEEKYKAVCKNISGGKSGTSTSTATPDGFIGGFFYYELD